MSLSISVIGATGKIGRILVPELIKTFHNKLDAIYLPGHLEKEPSQKMHLLAEQCRTIDNRVEVIPCTFKDSHAKEGITLFLADSELNQTFIAESIRSQKPVSRISLGKNNFQIIREYGLAFQDYRGKIMVVSNHVELCEIALQSYSHLPEGSITGLSWNDTLRLRGYIASLFQTHEEISGVAMIGTHDEHAVVSILPDAKIGNKPLFSFPRADELLNLDILEEQVKSFAVKEFLAFKDTAMITVKSIIEHTRFLLGEQQDNDFVFSHQTFRDESETFFCGMDREAKYFTALSEDRKERFWNGIKKVYKEFRKHHYVIVYGRKDISEGNPRKIFIDKQSADDYFDLCNLHYHSDMGSYYFYLTKFLFERKKPENFSNYLENFDQDSAKTLSMLGTYQDMRREVNTLAEEIGNSFDDDYVDNFGKEKFQMHLDDHISEVKKKGNDCILKILETIKATGKKDVYLLACLGDAYLTSGNISLALTTVLQAQQIQCTSFGKTILTDVFMAMGKDDLKGFENDKEEEKEKMGVSSEFREGDGFWYYKYLAFGKKCERSSD